MRMLKCIHVIYLPVPTSVVAAVSVCTHAHVHALYRAGPVPTSVVAAVSVCTHAHMHALYRAGLHDF